MNRHSHPNLEFTLFVVGFMIFIAIMFRSCTIADAIRWHR